MRFRKSVYGISTNLKRGEIITRNITISGTEKILSFCDEKSGVLLCVPIESFRRELKKILKE